MYTCRTCKLLQHSKAKKDIFRDEDGTAIEYKCSANSIIDVLSEWYCPYSWWNIRPSRGDGCMNWENMNGKHWI